MKIYSLVMKSFRGHEHTKVYFDESFNAFIGKNDVGKSTILEALEIFFNNDTVKIEVVDCNVFSDSKEIEIEVSFELENFSLTIDTVPTDLKEEYLLDDGRLTIRKRWSCSAKTITAASLKTFVVADYPRQLKPLVNLRITDLKKELEKISSIDQKSVNKTVAGSIRKAIYQSLENPQLEKTEIRIDKDKGREIWDSLKLELPIFCLFQSDRQNKDSDKEVQDPLKAITRSAISTLEKQLEDIKNDIKRKAEQLGLDTIEKLREMNPDIARVLKPEMNNRPWESLFSFTFSADDGIPVNKRGSGVRRLIMLNYFRAEAERKNENARNVIYAIEEPETSQHPDWQVKLIQSLLELSSKDNVQVLITTHSPYLTKLMKLETLRFVTKEHSRITVKTGSPEIIDEVIDTLGMLPDIGEEQKDDVKVVLCLEGPTDVKFFNKVDEIYGLNLEIDPRIMVLTVGGSTVSDWVNRDCLRKLRKKEIHIYDRDEDHKYGDIVAALNSKDNVYATLTKSLSIECYYHPRKMVDSIEDAREFFELNQGWQNQWKNKDVAKELSAFLKENSSQGMKPNTIKKRFADLVTLNQDDLLDLNVEEEVAEWFSKIREFIE